MKRPHRRLPHPASGLHRAIKQHELELAVFQAFLLENRVPCVLDIGEYGRCEVRELILIRPACLLDTSLAVSALRADAWPGA